LKFSQNSLKWIPTQCTPWRIPMCNHGSSLPLASPSSTMSRYSPSNKIGQIPLPNVSPLWRHECSLPYPQVKHS
jgi:hypothetical protein